MKRELIAIVGRPNVGKSRLFNRLSETQQAIVHDYEGVTRDRQYGDSEWFGRHYTVIDTGGFVPDSDEPMLSQMRDQAQLAMDEADLIIFGLSRTGKTPTSIFLSCRKLKVANIPIVLGRPFPRELIDLPVKRVGFRMQFERLHQLRTERKRRFRSGELSEYASEEHILKELEYCDRLYRRIPRLPKIDVTNRSIEETSEWITRHVL